MRLSFVVPAYNEEALLEHSLQAIRAEVARSGLAIGKDVEIIVVNNASTDRTADIAAAIPGVMVVDEPRKGLVQARWAGFVASQGALIANIDADTIIPAGWLAQAEAEFTCDPGLVALSGPYIYDGISRAVGCVVGGYYRLAFTAYWINRHVLHTGSMLQGGNFIVRRSAMEKLGAANERFSFYGEDTDLARRLSQFGTVKFTFRLRALSSGRRLQVEGVFTVGLRYTMNFFWATFLRKPFTRDWDDIRHDQPKS